ncbi:MAG: hypothetical protein A2Y79_13925 [Deltaproteobacteria bacterium RBG_13_43_22]|nr:MAG: hypothetical protein A2Y79_13925 [Deltaproteobacteria bacterium RBG_13_43_22]
MVLLVYPVCMVCLVYQVLVSHPQRFFFLPYRACLFFFLLDCIFSIILYFFHKKANSINDFKGCWMRKRRDPYHSDFIITVRKAIKDE